MKDNPIWRESVDIFFGEGHGFAVYFYLLAILAPVEFLSLYLPSLDAQMWTGSAALFKVSSVTALLLTVYFTLRVANQEFASWRFKPVRRWLQDQAVSIVLVGRAQLAFLFYHVGLTLLLCAPLLVWAGAIARTPLTSVAATFVFISFYAMSYGVWGLVTLVLWERRAESRQVIIRCFFFCLVFISALFYLPLNPVAFLLGYLGQQDLPPLSLGGMQWSAATVHFGFHFTIAAAGLATHRWALVREARF